MKTCPKCNEILGDSVEVCVKCKYHFEPDELKEVLERSESVRKISQKRMNEYEKNKKIILLSLFSCFFILTACILAIAAFLYVFGDFRIVEDGIRFYDSHVIPYDYTLYPDHAVVNNYRGQEQGVDIPDSLWGKPVTVIGEQCFRESNIVKVRIPETVVVIRISAFEHCQELIEVTGGGEVKTVGDHAFLKCSKLTNVELGTRLERIGDWAFRDCEQLKQFDRQDKMEYIGWYAFLDSGLEEFEFNSDADVRAEAFKDTPWLDRQAERFLVYGDGSLLYYNGPDGKIVIPDGVETMQEGSFVGLTDSEIFLPQTVQIIEANCFKNCTNIKIYIPSSVEEIGINMEKQMESVDAPEEIKEYYMSVWIMDDQLVLGKKFLSGCSDVAIVTTKGSYAEKYAEKFEIPCEIVKGW